MRPFLVCIHDATPAYATETRLIIGDLTPIVGRHLSFGVVPDWNGDWPLANHPDYCRLIRESSDELLLHGYFHRRQRGSGLITLLTDGCDEMSGLNPEATRRTIESGQRVFLEVFGKPARVFLPPGWQRGRVRPGNTDAPGIENVLGFFSLDSAAGVRVPLATSTWDCSRWGWTGHIGHGIGWALQSLSAGVPVLAIHPRDIRRGFWPGILRLTEELLRAGYEPVTPAGLLEVTEC